MFKKISVISAAVFLLIIGPYTYCLSKDVDAVVTEVKRGQGKVEMKPAGKNEWKEVVPLQSLSDGDELRSLKDGYIVVVYPKGGRQVKINESNSPYIIKGEIAGLGKSKKVEIALNKVTDFMKGKQKAEITKQPLAIRALMPVDIISPKDTKILTEQPYFEWAGLPKVFHSLKIYDGDKVVWEKKGLDTKEIAYPQDAPALVRNKKYIFEVVTRGQPPARATFTIASADEKDDIEKDLSEMEKEGSFYGSTLAIMQSMLLIEKGFYYDARRILISAISRDPMEPSLYRLLGRIYDEQQITWLSEETYREAELWGATGN